MCKRSNCPSSASQSEFDQSLLANTTRTEHRDEHGEVFYVSYQMIELTKPSETTKFSCEQSRLDEEDLKKAA